MVNIQEVARLADVSTATVSRVINNSSKVSPKTRRKVEEAIAKLNYVPNALGRNLRLSESRTILVMITSISNLFYTEIVRGISEIAYENGYEILLSETNADLRRQLNCLLKVKNRITDGAIIVESTFSDEVILSLEKNYPVVQCSGYNDDAFLPYVTLDNRKGGYMAAKFLLEKGHRTIAFIGTGDKFRYNRDRKAGFLQAIEEAGIQQDKSLIIDTDLSFEGGRSSALQLVKRKNTPTALFYVSDMQAVGAINELTASGYRVPDDVAVMGFDNIEICDMVVPGLTTVAQPMRQMGRESARILIDRIRNAEGGGFKSVIFQPEIVQRHSV